MLGYRAANNWVTLVKHTPHPINPSLECQSYPENQRHLRNVEILFFSKKEETAPLILCFLHMLGERLQGPKESPRMQTICYLAQKLSNFNSASGICCMCLCPILHSENFVEVAWRILSSRLTASAYQGQDGGRKAKPKVMTINQRKSAQDRAKHHRGKEVCVREFSNNEEHLAVSIKKYAFLTMPFSNLPLKQTVWWHCRHPGIQHFYETVSVSVA